MRKLYRFLISVYSLLTAIAALLFLSFLLNGTWAAAVPVFFAVLTYSRKMFWLATIGGFVIFALSVGTLVYALLTGRLRHTRLRKTENGIVEIGVDALESIALNSARAAQAGIKTAKARIYAAQGAQINVDLTVVLYSDVEIPAQMAKIQERIKKDIERYSGIPVAQVSVNVSRVELVGAKVE
ncbi:alkaline shock response membrane anchor protein AmaP [Mageeibacillus indolicus]|uniref:Alkaline shock response membrane anchor protein AmaP n=2 Tax=Mageeibacillus indolicus TaxID=884684 RepID=D3R2V7_MAGIU|nr:alkaline shock response membrane anchor protein AmaP [Mageeibacillus indolicus]ADC91286.1 hypothetical protein HMPREF0868_1238 [Mageeibacillus indolicus UPII9-5]KFA57376.1 hypothetical protein HMPREF1632_04320 [Mageeibacillus indolicus 0009-5]PNH19971.1 hypothetical protein B7R76_03640 [Mageeibacillus indolicus]